MWELLPIVAFGLLVWLLLIRPAQRRARAVSQVQTSLAIGDEVMLTSGFFGTVRALHDDRLDLELSAGVVVSVARGAVANVVHPDDRTDLSPEPVDLQDDTPDVGTRADDAKEG